MLINLFTGHWDYSDYSQHYAKLVNGTAILPDDSFVGQQKTLFSELMALSPYLYILCYYVIGGLYAGMYACLGLALSLFLKNRYIILFVPLIIYLGCWFFITLIGPLAWDPFNFLDPKQPVVGLSYIPFITDFTVFLFIACIIYIFGVKKNFDILP